MNTFTPTQNINDKALQKAVEAVEENKRLNDGQWSDWQDADDIAAAFDIDLDDECLAVLNRAIESNGQSLISDLPAVELAVWGYNTSDKFWNPSNN